ncbi:MAG: haloalkane dehalogenase [Pirellulaceae bacterium]|nr:MAG: haloalkane dehalogenase [Pirellulaceae bacterium]GIW95503.1 MAG: haloalkane dehalogenase [Pirellulaceae bacterium]
MDVDSTPENVKRTDAPDWRRLYPFESHYLNLEDVRLHYLDEGQGTPVLLVHGNPTWSFYWRRLVLAFRDRYRVVVPDHVGCGLSDKPRRYPYHLVDRIHDLLYLIEFLDLDNLTVVGHDWGGAIATGAALRMPRRVRRLVLMNTGAFPPPYVPWPLLFFRIPLLGTLAVRGANLFLKGALRWATCRPERWDAVMRAGYLAPYGSWSNRVAIDRFVKDIPLSPRHPTWYTLKRIEAGLPFLENQPACIVWGMQDWCFTRVCLERLRRLLPQAEVHCLPQAGHWLVEDAPEEVIDRVSDFLARTDG